MPEPAERWVLYQYVDGKIMPLSRPFKTKEQAEKARLKFPEKERKRIGLGVVWMQR
jgi:hypothetical protein